jgi:hypothetical protein
MYFFINWSKELRMASGFQIFSRKSECLITAVLLAVPAVHSSLFFQAGRGFRFSAENLKLAGNFDCGAVVDFLCVDQCLRVGADRCV